MSQAIAVTGVSGQLGRLVAKDLQRRAPGAQLIGLARNPAAAKEILGDGIELRAAEYEDTASLDRALQSVDKLLLISASDVGTRAMLHKNVIDAAKRANVKLLAYTSILHADSNPILMAEEHKETEAAILASGIPYVLLRNGWYNENDTGSIGMALQYGAVIGASKDGKISSAARADYAAAAAAVIAGPGDHAGKTYELAGDSGHSMAEFAAEIAEQSGKPVVYNDMPEAAFKEALIAAGLPEALAIGLADASAKTANGALYDDSGQLSQLIGRATTPMKDSVAAALAALAQ
jgi:NAD(P)H dehydrogenase (quinone)